MAIQQPLPAAHEHSEPAPHQHPQHHPQPASGISPAQNEALKIHNQAREAISKQTSVHRPDLIWDPHLAAAAEEWAHYLASRDVGLQHSTGAERPGQGENLYWTSAGGTLADGSQCWVDERKVYRGEKIGEGNFEGYGHYTQVIWPSTTHVGVAMAKTRNGANFIVGRYSGPGNYTGSRCTYSTHPATREDEHVDENITELLRVNEPAVVKPAGRPPGAKNKKKRTRVQAFEDSTQREPSEFEHILQQRERERERRRHQEEDDTRARDAPITRARDAPITAAEVAEREEEAAADAFFGPRTTSGGGAATSRGGRPMQQPARRRGGRGGGRGGPTATRGSTRGGRRGTTPAWQQGAEGLFGSFQL